MLEICCSFLEGNLVPCDPPEVIFHSGSKIVLDSSSPTKKHKISVDSALLKLVEKKERGDCKVNGTNTAKFFMLDIIIEYINFNAMTATQNKHSET